MKRRRGRRIPPFLGVFRLAYPKACVVCGVRSMVCGLWLVLSGLCFVVCGVWFVVYGLWLVLFGLWSGLCGMWSVVAKEVAIKVVLATFQQVVPATFRRRSGDFR